MLRRLVLLGLAVAHIQTVDGSAICSSPTPTFPPTSNDVDAFVQTVFDVIVVGGGTAGLALASRLAEDASVMVGVIEAGRFHLDDPVIDIPQLSGTGNGDPDYDWLFASTPQPNAGGRNIAIPRGKLLGGSSGLNKMAWTRASKLEYDSWVPFASPDWSFSELLPQFKRTENTSITGNPYPDASQLQPPARFAGFTGPIHIEHYSQYPSIVLSVAQTLNNIGVPTNSFPQTGYALGVSNSYQSVDKQTGMRSYAAKAYWCLQPAKANLKILTGAQATKVLFANSTNSSSPLLARAVQFSALSQLYTANATKQIVISSGSLQTPQLLELSGIGNSSRLSALGIPVAVNLPSVGENLQEHVYSLAQFELVAGQMTFDIIRTNATFAQEQRALYNATGTGIYATSDSTTVFLSDKQIVNNTRRTQLLSLLDQDIAAAGVDAPLRSAQLLAQRAFLTSGNVAIAEIIQFSSGLVNPGPNESYVTLLGGLMHPASRGNVHINTTDPLALPAVNLGFLTSVFDQQIMIDIIKYVTGLGAHRPFEDLIAERTTPPNLSTDAEYLAYIQETCNGGGHIVGTAVMAPRELGGVVDHDLLVYGTQNLRVVDASVFPVHVGTHTQATVYALAEKAAGIIARVI